LSNLFVDLDYMPTVIIGPSLYAIEHEKSIFIAKHREENLMKMKLETEVDPNSNSNPNPNPDSNGVFRRSSLKYETNPNRNRNPDLNLNPNPKYNSISNPNSNPNTNFSATHNLNMRAIVISPSVDLDRFNRKKIGKNTIIRHPHCNNLLLSENGLKCLTIGFVARLSIGKNPGDVS
jgi:hypothetical protein